MSKLKERLGLKEKQLQDAKVISLEGFKPLESGIYEGTVRCGIVEKKTREGKTYEKLLLVYKINNDTEDGKTFEVEQSLNKKDSEELSPYALSTFSQLQHATGVDIEEADLTTEPDYANMYGQKCKVDWIVGTDKEAVALFVYETVTPHDNNRKGNKVIGFTPMDFTNTKGEDQKQPFLDRIEETPVMTIKERKPAGGSTSGAIAKSNGGGKVKI